jgi:hypothetical protein
MFGSPGYVLMWPLTDHINRYGRVGEEMVRRWSSYVQAQGENAVIIVDENHQLSLPVTMFSNQRAIGLRLNGSIVKRVRRGDCTRLEWWRDAPEQTP